MSTLKEYARRAKQRMKSGFWENAREIMQKEKEVAATLGLDSYQVASRQHAALQRQIYDYDGFCREQQFNAKVQEILASKEVISNPIMRLADQKYMQTLSPQEKQLYISRLSARYREAVERFSRERR